MRLIVTFFALAFSICGWSAELDACNEADAVAVRSKLGEYILRVPDAPQNRWVVWKSGESWQITEYKGLRVSIEHEDVIQFEWQYDAAAFGAALMPASDINRYFSAIAKITKGAPARDYYPALSIRRRETGNTVVQSCVGPNGKLLRDPTVVESSGFPELDRAAIKMAKDTQYAAGTEGGVALAESCVEFTTRFQMK